MAQPLLLGLALVPRFLQQNRFLAQRLPRAKHRQQSMRLIIPLQRIGARAHRWFHAVFAGLMFRLQPLDLRLRIAARLLQILRRIVQLVLIQIHLRFGDVDLILQIILL